MFPHLWLGGVGEDKVLFILSHKDIGIARGHFGTHAGSCKLKVRNTIENEIVFCKNKFHQLNKGYVARFDIWMWTKPIQGLFSCMEPLCVADVGVQRGHFKAD